MKRYILNEGTSVKSLFRPILNESAIEDMEKKLQDAFTYAGKRWNGIMVKDVPYYDDWYLVDVFTDINMLPRDTKKEMREIDRDTNTESNANMMAMAVNNLYRRYGDNPYPRVWDWNDFDEDENGKTNIDNACEWLSKTLNCVIRMQHVTIDDGGENIENESEQLTLFYKGSMLMTSPDTPEELYDDEYDD